MSLIEQHHSPLSAGLMPLPAPAISALRPDELLGYLVSLYPDDSRLRQIQEQVEDVLEQLPDLEARLEDVTDSLEEAEGELEIIQDTAGKLITSLEHADVKLTDEAEDLMKELSSCL